MKVKTQYVYYRLEKEVQGFLSNTFDCYILNYKSHSATHHKVGNDLFEHIYQSFSCEKNKITSTILVDYWLNLMQPELSVYTIYKG